jgi:hypothetical protein
MPSIRKIPLLLVALAATLVVLPAATTSTLTATTTATATIVSPSHTADDTPWSKTTK